MLRPHSLIAFVTATVAATAAAQAPPAGEPGTSLHPPALSYQSPLDGYKPFVEEELVPWKEANDNVARIGGWRTYAREARPDPGRPQDPAAGKPEPGSPGGTDHHKH